MANPTKEKKEKPKKTKNLFSLESLVGSLVGSYIEVALLFGWLILIHAPVDVVTRIGVQHVHGSLCTMGQISSLIFSLHHPAAVQEEEENVFLFVWPQCRAGHSNIHPLFFFNLFLFSLGYYCLDIYRRKRERERDVPFLVSRIYASLYILLLLLLPFSVYITPGRCKQDERRFGTRTWKTLSFQNPK